VYVGKGQYIGHRIHQHAQDWYSHAWDNVSWFAFEKSVPDAFITAVEALLIATLRTSLNGASPTAKLGKRCYPGKDRNYADNTLWQK
jgi:hypothetical protein